MSAAIAVGVLTAGGVFLLLQGGLLRAVLGFALLGHAVNLLILSAGGMARREPPFLGSGNPAEMADPLPQAFVLTAIVISFGATVFLLGLLASGSDRTRHGDEDGCGEDEVRDGGSPAHPDGGWG